MLTSPVEKKKVFYLNNYHNNGMVTVTSALKICKSYISNIQFYLRADKFYTVSKHTETHI
jgi:hypothetical protein